MPLSKDDIQIALINVAKKIWQSSVHPITLTPEESATVMTAMFYTAKVLCPDIDFRKEVGIGEDGTD